MYPEPPLVTSTPVTAPPLIVTEATPPVPSPRIGTLAMVALSEPPATINPVPLFLMIIVSIFPSTAAFFIDSVVASPQSEGTGINLSVVNFY